MELYEMNNKVVIVGAKRTPIGSFQGQFSTVTCDELLTRQGLQPMPSMMF
jgi:hypothetical protein